MADVAQNSPLPLPTKPWVDPDTGMPSRAFTAYMQMLDRLMQQLIPLTNILNNTPFLTTAGHQDLLGGFTETEFDNGTPVNGASITINPSNGLKQKITNNVAGFTIVATAECGDLELRVINGASAGTITFSGFSVQWLGDAIDTVSGHQFVILIFGYVTKVAYVIKALQ